MHTIIRDVKTPKNDFTFFADRLNRLVSVWCVDTVVVDTMIVDTVIVDTVIVDTVVVDTVIVDIVIAMRGTQGIPYRIYPCASIK
jgi:uracil phosphoribosyltransferase